MKCKYHEKFDEECIWCSRQKRFEKVKNDEPQPFYIVIYGITRNYGGPEEGGLYYDWQRLLENPKKVWTISKALKIIRELKDEYHQPRYDRFSVLGGEDIKIQLIPTLDFIYEDTKRPRYE